MYRLACADAKADARWGSWATAGTDAPKRAGRSRGGQARPEAHRAIENCNINWIGLRIALGSGIGRVRNVFDGTQRQQPRSEVLRTRIARWAYGYGKLRAPHGPRRGGVAQAPFLVISMGVFDASARRWRTRTRTRADLRAAVPIRNSATLNMVTFRSLSRSRLCLPIVRAPCASPGNRPRDANCATIRRQSKRKNRRQARPATIGIASRWGNPL